MSFLSTSGNVGFSGIPQNLSEASCATQYKMAVEGVPACGGDGNTYIHDSSGDEQIYMPHITDNFFHTKYKIDPNDLYTFHDSDVIAGEITVSHTDDSSLVFMDPNEVKTESIVNSELDVIGNLVNGEIKHVKDEIVLNGHYSTTTKSGKSNKESIIPNTKVQNVGKSQHRSNKESVKRNQSPEKKRTEVQNFKGPSGNNITTPSVANTKVSISNVKVEDVKLSSVTKNSASETFLDVFKREQMGFVESSQSMKTETSNAPAKVPVPISRKTTPAKPSTTVKSKRGRGPAVHEALQRIPSQRRAQLQQNQVQQNQVWHSPGNELFECGPLTEQPPHPFTRLDSSSEDEEQMPNFSSWISCPEEGGGDARGTRLANRRAALRRQVAQAAAALKLLPSHRKHRALARLVSKQKNSSSQLPTRIVVRLLAARGMSGLLTSHDRRQLREAGWSGGESGNCFLEPGAALAATGSAGPSTVSVCAVEGCSGAPLPCGRFCLTHVTLAPEQRLYAACAAVFAGGTRCKQPLLPLHDQTPLCIEHAWKRDNYDKISRECKPKKVVRKRVLPTTPRRAKRRRRPPAKRAQPTPVIAQVVAPISQSLSEVGASNSSAYESAEEVAVGALSESEFIVTTTADLVDGAHRLEVGVVEQVPPDDILDPAVLSQIPDEAFTEFFNQTEGAPAFAESEELERALEAVLDERALDSLADCVFHHQPRNKLQVPPSVGMEMSSSAPS